MVKCSGIKGMPLSNYREMFIKLWVEQLVKMNNFLIILTYFNKVGQPPNWIRKPFLLLIGCEQIWYNRSIHLQENRHFVSSNSFKVYLKIRFSKELLFQSGITPLFKVGIQ